VNGERRAIDKSCLPDEFPKMVDNDLKMEL